MGRLRHRGLQLRRSVVASWSDGKLLLTLMLQVFRSVRVLHRRRRSVLIRVRLLLTLMELLVLRELAVRVR